MNEEERALWDIVFVESIWQDTGAGSGLVDEYEAAAVATRAIALRRSAVDQLKAAGPSAESKS